jgi:hypothetical protein
MNHRLRVGAGVHARRFGDEVVLVDVRQGVYFSLNEVGSIVWQALESGASLDQVVSGVITAFAVDEATARADVIKLTDELVAAGLLERLGDER